jgi:hypothetical protein
MKVPEAYELRFYELSFFFPSSFFFLFFFFYESRKRNRAERFANWSVILEQKKGGGRGEIDMDRGRWEGENWERQVVRKPGQSAQRSTEAAIPGSKVAPGERREMSMS